MELLTAASLCFALSPKPIEACPERRFLMTDASLIGIKRFEIIQKTEKTEQKPNI